MGVKTKLTVRKKEARKSDKRNKVACLIITLCNSLEPVYSEVSGKYILHFFLYYKWL